MPAGATTRPATAAAGGSAALSAATAPALAAAVAGSPSPSASASVLFFLVLFHELVQFGKLSLDVEVVVGWFAGRLEVDLGVQVVGVGVGRSVIQARLGGVRVRRAGRALRCGRGGPPAPALAAAGRLAVLACGPAARVRARVRLRVSEGYRGVRAAAVGLSRTAPAGLARSRPAIATRAAWLPSRCGACSACSACHRSHPFLRLMAANR